MTTIHPGIFLGWALWADSVSPWMNTIASRDQFKPIRIGKRIFSGELKITVYRNWFLFFRVNGFVLLLNLAHIPNIGPYP